jgi:pyruvate formate lyase activating enzyme
VASVALDPVEKKPLFHFYPGTSIYSVGVRGCNFDCGFCQNWSLAHGQPPSTFVPPQRLVALAEEARAEGNIGIAYTYSEPTVWYEYVLDTARLAHRAGLKNVMVTNGFIESEPLQELLPYLDAMNIDLKSFREEYYRRTCHGRLSPVMATIAAAQAATHVEVTTLLVTGLNDSEQEVEELAAWLASVNPDIVLHLSRYFPAYRFTLPPTPVDTIRRAREVARRHLRYVYVGNVVGMDDDTRCAGCGQVLVQRDGYFVRLPGVKAGTCSNCGTPVPFVM